MSTEDEFDALLGSLNFESIRLPNAPVSNSSDAPDAAVDPFDDEDYGELQLAPRASSSVAMPLPGAPGDDDSNTRLGALPPLPATLCDAAADEQGDSNRDFSHVDAASLDDILDLPDLPASPKGGAAGSAAASSSSPYGQFPTAPKHAVASNLSTAEATAATASPRIARPVDQSKATTPGYSVFPTGAAAARQNLEAQAAAADGRSPASNNNSSSNTSSTSNSNVKSTTASPARVVLAADRRAQLKEFLERKHILSDDGVSLRVAQADAVAQSVSTWLFNDWLVLARKDDAGSLADSERIMLGDCAVVGVVDATLKLAAVLNDSEALPPAAAPQVPATTGSRLSGRRSSKHEAAPESEEADGDAVVLPRTDVWLTFASHDRAVEWGTTLGSTIEEWKKKNEKNLKKKGGIKGFMRRATSAFALKKSSSRDGKRGKGKPVQVPDSWRPILEASGVTDEHLSDPESLSSILAAVDEWSAAAATKKKAVPPLPSAPVSRPSSSPSPASESPRSMSPRSLPTRPAPRPDSAQDRATKLALLSASAPGILDSPTLTTRVEVTSSPQESPRQHAHSVGGSVASDVSMTPPSDDESFAPPRLVAAHARQQYVQIPVNPAVTAASVEAPDDLDWPDIPTMQDFPPPGSGTFDEISLNETLKRAVLSIEINKKQHQPMERASQVNYEAQRQTQHQHQQQQQMYMQQQQQLQQHHQQQQQQQQRAAESHPSASTGAQLINVVRQSERNVRSLMNQMLCVLGSNPPNEFVTVQRLLELIGGAMESFVGATRQYGQAINDVVIGSRATELSNDTTVRFRALAGAIGQNNVAMSQGLREQILQRLYGVQHAAFALRDFICDEPLGSRFPFVCAFPGCTRAYELAPDMVLHCRKRHAGMALQRPSQAAAATSPDGGAQHGTGRNASGTVLIGNAVGNQSGFGPQPVRRPSMNQQPQQQQTPYSHFGHASASSPQLRR